MSRKLPSNAIDMTNGRHQAAEIAEACSIAYWMHGRDSGCALFHFEAIHKQFAALADALGYDITERPQPAADEATA